MAEQSSTQADASAAGTGLPTRFQLEIVTPEGQLVDEQVSELLVPGYDGQLGVLPQHTRYLTILGVGEMAYRSDGEWLRLAVADGLIEIQPDRVIVLAQTAELAEQIDIERARLAKERAEERLAHPDEDTDLDRARAALTRAMVRLRTASRDSGGR